MTHKDINIPFQIGDRQYEAVGFLEEKEESATGEEAIKRCDNGQLIQSNEDWDFIYTHKSELPQELNVYWLLTARPNPVNPRSVSSLRHAGAKWYGHWLGLGFQWLRFVLVLRRRMGNLDTWKFCPGCGYKLK